MGSLWAKVERCMEKCNSAFSCERLTEWTWQRKIFAHRRTRLLHHPHYLRERSGPRSGRGSRNQLRSIALLLATTGLCAAEETRPDIPADVALQWGQPCDAQNGRLYVGNAHSFRTAIVTVRWQAAGGKALEQQFILEPGVITEVGCALSDATIVKAELASF